MAAVLNFSCTKTEIVYPTTGKTVVSPVDLTVYGSKTTYVFGDTLMYVERGSLINLRAIINDSTLRIKNWTWKFYDDNSTGSGQNISHNFNIVLSKTMVKISATDDKGKVYEKTRVIFPVLNITYYWGVQTVTSAKNADGSLNAILALNKAGMKWYSGSRYAFVGNVSQAVGWDNTQMPIAATDTSYNFNEGTINYPSGTVGNYIFVRLTLSKGDGYLYNMGAGKIVGNTLDWGTFWGDFVSEKDPTMIKFKTSGLQIIPLGTE